MDWSDNPRTSISNRVCAIKFRRVLISPVFMAAAAPEHPRHILRGFVSLELCKVPKVFIHVPSSISLLQLRIGLTWDRWKFRSWSSSIGAAARWATDPACSPPRFLTSPPQTAPTSSSPSSSSVTASRTPWRRHSDANTSSLSSSLASLGRILFVLLSWIDLHCISNSYFSLLLLQED